MHASSSSSSSNVEINDEDLAGLLSDVEGSEQLISKRINPEGSSSHYENEEEQTVVKKQKVKEGESSVIKAQLLKEVKPS